MSLAQLNDFLDQKRGGKFLVVFKNKEDQVVDGIEIKMFGRDRDSIKEQVNDYANDLMAREGIVELNWEIHKK